MPQPQTPNPKPLVSRRCNSLKGIATPPGDKSMSHRAVMLGGIAEGVTTVRGLLEGEDVLHTVAALKALGAKIVQERFRSGTSRARGWPRCAKPSSHLIWATAARRRGF